MQIVADAEGFAVVQELCNLALKAGGLQNLNSVNAILAGLSKQESTVERPLNGPVRPQ